MEYKYYKTSADWQEITKEEIDEIFDNIEPIWRDKLERSRMFIKKGKFRYKAIPIKK